MISKFPFQCVSHNLNIVPIPLWLLGRFGKMQFFKLALLILVHFASRKSLAVTFFWTTAYQSICRSWWPQHYFILYYFSSLVLLHQEDNTLYTKLLSFIAWCKVFAISMQIHVVGCCVLRYIHNFLFIQWMDQNPFSTHFEKHFPRTTNGIANSTHFSDCSELQVTYWYLHILLSCFNILFLLGFNTDEISNI